MQGASDDRPIEKANGDSGLVHKLSMRCSQFLNQLDDKWQADHYLADLFNSNTLHETISVMKLQSFVTDFMKEIKEKHDVQMKIKEDSEKWSASEINIIHRRIKDEIPANHSPRVPDHWREKRTELESHLKTIHAKLNAILKSQPKETGATGFSRIPASSSSSKTNKSSERKDVMVGDGDKALKEKVKDLQTKNKTLNEDLKQAKANNDNRTMEFEKQEKKNKETVAEKEKQIMELEQRLDEGKSAYSRLKSTRDSFEQKLHESEETNKKLIIEINELKSRYSALAGSKMSNENPDIADLSDQFRPTKLAEMYSQLYDDEWTDAYGSLHKRGEEQAIQTLLNILQDVNTFCRQEAELLKQQLKRVIQDTCALSNVEDKRGATQAKQVRKAKQQSDERFSGKQKDQPGQTDFVKDQQITELMRASALQPVKALQQKFQMDPVLKKKLPKPDETNILYVNKCVELCWLMAIQSPPVVIDDKDHKKQPFDERRFKPYTKKGQIIDYVVWPILYIPGGGMLGKGVAQCK